MGGWGRSQANWPNATHPYGNSLMRQHVKSHEQMQLNNQVNTAVLNYLFTPIMSFLLYTHTFLHGFLFDPSPQQTDTVHLRYLCSRTNPPPTQQCLRGTLFRSHNKRSVVLWSTYNSSVVINRCVKGSGTAEKNNYNAKKCNAICYGLQNKLAYRFEMENNTSLQ